MRRRTAALPAACLALALAALPGAARAEPLGLTVRPGGPPLFLQHAHQLRGNPNVTPSNPMGVVGWDGPPGDVPDVIGDSEPLPAGSIAAAPYDLLGRALP